MNEPINVQYSDHTVRYTTQFMASVGTEEVILDCGSIVVANAAEKQLPVHTRMALPWSAVQRLHDLLGQLLQSQSTRPQPDDPVSMAALPPLSIDAGSSSSEVP